MWNKGQSSERSSTKIKSKTRKEDEQFGSLAENTKYFVSLSFDTNTDRCHKKTLFTEYGGTGGRSRLEPAALPDLQPVRQAMHRARVAPNQHQQTRRWF